MQEAYVDFLAFDFTLLASLNAIKVVGRDYDATKQRYKTLLF